MNLKTYIKKIIYLVGEDKKEIPLIILFFLIISLFEIVGLGLIAPYVSLIINVDNLQSLNFYNLTNGLLNNQDNEDLLILFGIILFLLFSFKTILILLINKKVFNFSNRTGAKLRSNLLSCYQNIDYNEYTNRNSSQYVFSIQELCTSFAQNTMVASMRMISDGILAISILIFLAFTDFFILLLVTLLIVSFIYLYDLLLGDKIIRYGSDTNLYRTKIIQTVNEAISGYKEIKILNKEKFFYDEVSENSLKYADTYTKLLVLESAPRYVLELMLLTSLLIIVFLAIYTGDLVNIIPTLTVFSVSGLRLMPAANTFSNGLSQLRFGYDATNIIYNDLYNNKRIKTKEKAKQVKNFESLNLNNVSFSYGTKNIFKNVSLPILKGHSIGIIGATGSGKTTLINMILGLISPTSGDMVLNQKKINNKLNPLKGLSAYIPQNTFLVDDTVKKNVALGLKEHEINNDKIMSALKLARLSTLIEELPYGINTNIGENGSKLSGGQRQRLTLARAFYFNRQLFVMDEATSALDGETESEITNAIKELKGKVTTILVAHRYTTLRECDSIYEIENGNVTYKGQYNDIA